VTKPSLLIINRVFPPQKGATGRLAFDLSQAVIAEGWDVTVLSTGASKNNHIRDGVRHVTVKESGKPHSFIGYIKTLGRLRRNALKLPRHTVVITMTDPPLSAIIGQAVKKKKKSVHIHWSQDVYPQLFKKLNIKVPERFYAKAQQLSLNALNNADHVVTIGRCMQAFYNEAGVKSPMSVIANWTNLHGSHLNKKPLPSKVNSSAPDAKVMKADQSAKFRIIYAGNLGRAHPVKIIIETAEKLKDYQEIEFLFVGDGHSHSRLAQERDKRDLHNIKFLPFQPAGHFQKILETGDLHLVSLRDGLQGLAVPCKFYTAIAVGRPVIFVGPKESEIAQVIEDYQSGSIVEELDADTLAQTILHYRQNGEKWFSAQEGASRAGQEFYPQASLDRWISLLKTAKTIK